MEILSGSGDRQTSSSSKKSDPSDQEHNNASTSSAVNYEHVVTRYGYWRNVRSQVFANFFLLMLGTFHKNHVDHVKSISSLHTVTQGRHGQCCCEIPVRLEKSHDEGHLVVSTSLYALLPYLLAVVVAFLAPAWERPLGRRLMSLILCGIGAVISPFLLFCTESVLSSVANHVIDMPSFLIVMIAISNLVELLPCNLRFLAVALYHLAQAFTKSIALLHFLYGFCLIQLGVMSFILFIIGFALVFRFAEEPICHLIMRNLPDELLERIEANEERIWETDDKRSYQYYMQIAQKVFTDLTTAEQDELSFLVFLKHIGKSWITVEMVVALLQSISSGFFEFEYTQLRRQLFIDPFFVQAEVMVGYTLVLAILFLLRKTHRNRSIAYLMSAMICVAIIIFIGNSLILSFDLRNKCADDHAFIQRQLNFASFLLDACFYAVCNSLQMMITLNFLEAVPSAMRLSSVVWVYLPLKIAQEICKKVLKSGRLQTPLFYLLIYIVHIIVIVITISRTRNNSRARNDKRISMYLFELMPSSEISVSAKSYVEDEKSPVEEKTAREVHVSESAPDVTSPLLNSRVSEKML